MSALLEREQNVWTCQLQRNDGEVLDSVPFEAYWSPPDEGVDSLGPRGNVTSKSIADACAVQMTMATKPNRGNPESKPRHSFVGLSAILSGGPAFARRYGEDASPVDEGETAPA